MSTLRLPGLIDPHVHVRDLGQRHKDNWDSCTAAALAGGFTTILAMPNTQPPIVDDDSLTQYEFAAQQRARCDYGLYLGSSAGNVHTARQFAPRTAGLKMYLDATFGMLKMEGLDLLVEHAANWPADKPLLAHAEAHQCAAAILAAHLAGRGIHICHVSRKSEIELIAKAKAKGLQVTCEVCPHHLFTTLEDSLLPPGFIEVRPMIQHQEDVDALWVNLDSIDCFGTDHASHTVAEKRGDKPPPGYPGLEQALGLWLTAVHAGRLTLDEVIARMVTNPRRIFGVPEQPETWIEVDVDLAWQVQSSRQYTKAGWTPYEGWTLRGKAIKTVVRGEVAFDGERVWAAPGMGKNIALSG